MISITGIPKVGKTTICKMLSSNGIECVSADSLALNLGCMEKNFVDLDCMKSRMLDLPRVIESHYSHLLMSSHVIILKSDPDEISARMRLAGYSDEKIAENIDAQISDTIYYESIERLPASRVIALELTGKTLSESFCIIRDKIIEIENLTSGSNHNGS